MPNLFTPRADFRLRLGLLVVLLVVIGLPIALMIYVRTPYITEQGVSPVQPVEFDHRHHVRDDGIDCLYCHDGADRSPHAGIPPAELCMGCHSQIRIHDPTLGPVRLSYFEREPIAWQRVHDMPDFVQFDHSIHVTRGITCTRCHGEVEQMAWVRKVYTMNMGWCLECHEPGPPPAYGQTHEPLEPGQRLTERGDPVGPSYCTACHR